MVVRSSYRCSQKQLTKKVLSKKCYTGVSIAVDKEFHSSGPPADSFPSLLCCNMLSGPDLAGGDATFGESVSSVSTAVGCCRISKGLEVFGVIFAISLSESFEMKEFQLKHYWQKWQNQG